MDRLNDIQTELQINGEKRYALEVAERAKPGKEPTWQRLVISDRKINVSEETSDGMVFLCQDSRDDKRPECLFVIHRQSGEKVQIDTPPVEDNERSDFGHTLSADGKFVAVILKAQVLIIDSTTGREVQAFDTPEEEFEFTHSSNRPQFTADGKTLAL
jgi:hypothetical protein